MGNPKVVGSEPSSLEIILKLFLQAVIRPWAAKAGRMPEGLVHFHLQIRKYRTDTFLSR